MLLGTSKKSILCIAPFPPPIMGAAAVSKAVVDHLKQSFHVLAVDYQKDSLVSGKFSYRQFRRIVSIGFKLIAYRSRKIECIYLVSSSSPLGALRDLFFLMIMGKSLRKKTVLHLHSSTNLRSIYLAIPFFLRSFARRIFGEARGAIVVGETWLCSYENLIPDKRIHVLKNSFEQDLLISREQLEKKYNIISDVNILFLSNFLKEKGYELLLDAFLKLPEDVRSKAILHFAGGFSSPEGQGEFLKKIGNVSRVIYHGVVSGMEKRNLLWKSHILCFPTYYRYETQGIVILEGYASGCIVLTSNFAGSKDIFVDGINGSYITPVLNCENLKNKLEMIVNNITKYTHIAFYNRNEAIDKYTNDTFLKKISSILVENKS